MPAPHHIKSQIVFYISFSLLIAGCSDQAPSFFPLEKGRTWHYGVTKTTMDGTFQQKFIIQTLPELTWQGTRSVPMLSAGGEQYLYQRSSSAIRRVAFKQEGEATFIAHDVPQTVLPEVLNLDNMWQETADTKLRENTGPPGETLFRIVTPVELKLKLETLDVDVTVPAGSFQNCLKVSGFGETNVDVGNYIGRTAITVKVERWYAKDIGLVKSLRTETTAAEAISSGTLTMELEYSVR